MKIIVAVILLVVLILIGNEIFFFWRKNQTVGQRYQELRLQLDKAEANYQRLEADFTYYLNPANLEKELRSRFNYRQPGEKFIIIVPRSSSSSNH